MKDINEKLVSVAGLKNNTRMYAGYLFEEKCFTDTINTMQGEEADHEKVNIL